MSVHGEPSFSTQMAQNLSTANRQTSMMVIVHLTSEKYRLLITICFSVLGQMDNSLLKTSQLEEKLQCKLHLPGVVACVRQTTELIRVSRIVAAALIRIEIAGIDRLPKLRMIQRVECLRPEL